MKRFLASVLLSSVILPAIAETQQAQISQNVFAPQWSDVCSHTAYWDIDVNKNYKKTEKKYWKERRIQFEKEVLACETRATDLESCYQDIISLEASRTEKWNTTYAEERKARMVKGGAAGAAILAIFYTVLRWW